MVLIIGFLVWFSRRTGMGGARTFTTAKAEVGDVPVTRFSEVRALRATVEPGAVEAALQP